MNPFVFDRPVRFDEVDAAGYVYFARIAALAHEGLERLLDARAPGLYAQMVRDRVGLPCVHLSADYRSPLRYGDAFEARVVTEKLGVSSATLGVTVTRGDGTECARVTYVVVFAELDAGRKRPLEGALREALSAHA